MADIDQILRAGEQQITQLASVLLAKFKDQAVADAHDFVQAMKVDFSEWTSALQAGQLDEDNFESLVRGEADLVKMRALKQRGLAQVAIDMFTDGITQILLNSAFAAIGF